MCGNISVLGGKLARQNPYGQNVIIMKHWCQEFQRPRECLMACNSTAELSKDQAHQRRPCLIARLTPSPFEFCTSLSPPPSSCKRNAYPIRCFTLSRSSSSALAVQSARLFLLARASDQVKSLTGDSALAKCEEAQRPQSWRACTSTKRERWTCS